LNKGGNTMKTTTQKLAMAWVIILFLFTQSAHALFDDRIDKANNALSEGNRPLAEQLLVQVRDDKKATDKEYYKAGLAYESLRSYNNAQICFKKIKGNIYRDKVVIHYQLPGDTAMENRNFKQALYYYKRLSDIDKLQGSKTVDILYEEGQEQWIASRNAPRDIWRVAFALDKFIQKQKFTPTGDKIAWKYYKEFMTDKRPCYDCYELSLEFSDKFREDIKKALSVLYNAKGISEGHKANLRKRLARLVKSKSELNKLAPPDFKLYKAGDKLFVKLPEGKITEKYIRFGKETRFDLHHNNNFEILPRHGKPIKVWKGDPLPKNYNFDFKVKAVNGLAALYAEIKKR